MREHLEALSNKSFAITCFNLLKQAGSLDKTALNNLTDPEWCETHFNMTGKKPILKEIPNTFSQAELKMYTFNGTNRSRFYSEVIHADDRSFIITNYWYGKNTNPPDNRTPFMEWTLATIKK